VRRPQRRSLRPRCEPALCCPPGQACICRDVPRCTSCCGARLRAVLRRHDPPVCAGRRCSRCQATVLCRPRQRPATGCRITSSARLEDVASASDVLPGATAHVARSFCGQPKCPVRGPKCFRPLCSGSA
ncbi:unnamed protein product, partial [Symbiodinium microadriaticum]